MPNSGNMLSSIVPVTTIPAASRTQKESFGSQKKYGSLLLVSRRPWLYQPMGRTPGQRQQGQDRGEGSGAKHVGKQQPAVKYLEADHGIERGEPQDRHTQHGSQIDQLLPAVPGRPALASSGLDAVPSAASAAR